MGRPAPTFWWDFTEDFSIIVQSDWPGGEALAVFHPVPGEQYCDVQIQQAEQLIADYRAGRKTPIWGNTLTK